MRKTYAPIITLILINMLLSCSEDDGVGETSTLTFNGETYTLVDAYVDYDGEEDPLETGMNTHFGYEVGVSDAMHMVIMDDGEEYFGGSDGVSIRLYVDIFRSTDSNSDIDGTYQFIDDETAILADVDGISFFTGGEIELDDDNLAPGGDLDGDEFEVVGGTITITGSDSNYTVSFDIAVVDGDNVPVGNAVGSYTGILTELN